MAEVLLANGPEEDYPRVKDIGAFIQPALPMNLFKTFAMVGLVGVGMEIAIEPLQARAFDFSFEYLSAIKPWLNWNDISS